MFFKASIQQDNGVVRYPVDIELIRNPLYSPDLTYLFFESDTNLDTTTEVQSVDEAEFTLFKDTIVSSIKSQEVPASIGKTELELLKEQLQVTQDAVDFLLLGGI